MKNNKIFISLALTAIMLVLTSLVLIGCSVEKRLRKLKLYSVLSEQHTYDMEGVHLEFFILANSETAPYTSDNIDNVQIEASHSFKEELTMKDVSKVSDENYKNEKFTSFCYKFKTRKGITPNYYKDAKLTFTLKNNDKITFKVGEFSVRNNENVTISEDGELLHYTSHDHKPNMEIPLIYRFGHVIYKYEYTNKPFIVESISYKFGDKLSESEYSLSTVGKVNTLEIKIPHREFLFTGVNLEITGIIDGKTIKQVIPAKVAYLTVAEYLTDADYLCCEPISKNF